MDLVINITQIVLYFGMFFSLIRLLIGPRILDRIMSMDGIGVCVIGILALDSMNTMSPYFMDLILVFSLFNFIGTVAFVYYLNKKYAQLDPVAVPEQSLQESHVLFGIFRKNRKNLVKGEDVEH